MTEARFSYLLNAEARGNWVRLRTLTSLRWIAIGGQSIAVAISSAWLGIDLPLELCTLIISASVCFNIVAHLVHPSEKRLSERGTMASLAFDLVQVSTLLMLTGGLANPFALLLLVPVTISASALRLRSTLILGTLGLALVAAMTFFNLPLTKQDGSVLTPPPLYLFGFAGSLALGVVFFSLYARRVAVEAFKMSEALNATQLALAREQRLAAIGGIAAAVAHEMGTPLATIKLVAGELARELEDQPALAEDAALIRSEAERCGRIMADLSQGGRDDAHLRKAPILAVIEEASGPHLNRIEELVVRINGAPAEEARDEHPAVPRSPELIHGLRNLIQNAADYARNAVWVDIDFDDRVFRVAIGDDGPGYPAEMIPILGEPYVTTRGRGSAERRRSGGYEGMGLGLFIARTLLERTGARVSFANGSDGRTPLRDIDPADVARPPGAIIEIIWPTASIVVARHETRAPLGQNERFLPV